MKNMFLKLLYLFTLLFVVLSFLFAVTTDIFNQLRSSESIFYYAYWALVLFILFKLVELFIKSEIFSYYFNKYYLSKEKP